MAGLKAQLTVLLGVVALLLVGAGCVTAPPQTTQLPKKTSDVASFLAFMNPPATATVTPLADADAIAGSSQQAFGVLRNAEPSRGDTTDAPSIQAGAEYFRSGGQTSVIGQARVRFVNAETGMAVPGHAADCSGCIDVYYAPGRFGETVYAESDADGVIVFNLTESDASVAYGRTDWYEYRTVAVHPGDDITIAMQPRIVGQNQTLSYPRVTYTKNADGKTKLSLAALDTAKQPVIHRNMTATGPIVGQKRTTATGALSGEGRVTLELPVSGSYRVELVGPAISGSAFYSFYEVNAMTGHTAHATIEADQETPKHAPPLAPDHLDRGFILVCPIDRKGGGAVYGIVGIPFSNDQFTRTVSYKGYVCTEVPRSYQEIYLPSTGIHNGHQIVSTAGVDGDGVLYVYVDSK